MIGRKIRLQMLRKADRQALRSVAQYIFVLYHSVPDLLRGFEKNLGKRIFFLIRGRLLLTKKPEGGGTMKATGYMILGSMTFSAVVLIATLSQMVRWERAAADSLAFESTIPTRAVETTMPAGYMVRLHNGRIGVFRTGESLPYRYLDAELSLLPELDRQLLEEGIPARDDAELQSLLEDLRE